MVFWYIETIQRFTHPPKKTKTKMQKNIDWLIFEKVSVCIRWDNWVTLLEYIVKNKLNKNSESPVGFDF